MANNLRGPNFDLIEYENVSAPGEFKSWDELLGTDTQSAQQILDSQLESDSISLNIDYSQFQNFIHYSSAVERVKNFKYKLELIESYTAKIEQLRSSSNVSPILLKSNLNDLYLKRNKLVSGFDNFEKYLFFGTDTGSKYTHMGQVDIMPWPKTSNVGDSLRWSEVYLNWQSWASEWSNGTDQDPYAYFGVLSPVNSDTSKSYYDSLLESAATYDRNNIYALDKTIPRYLVELSDNAEYILFINMIGQHFDIQWSYIKYMSSIHTREEHPLDGMPDDLLQSVASGLGFELLNGRSTSELWDYILDSGDRKSDSSVIKQIWRRIVNNLPEVLKSKGTARSIKALLSCYGIPSSALTIKEYGGPQVASDSNQLIEKSVFHYAWPIDWNSGILRQYIPYDIQYIEDAGQIFTLRIRFDPTYQYEVDSKYTIMYSGSGQYGYGAAIYFKYNQDTTFSFYYTSIIGPDQLIYDSLQLKLGEWYTLALHCNALGESELPLSTVINCDAYVYDKDLQYHVRYPELPIYPEQQYITTVSSIPDSVFDTANREFISDTGFNSYIESGLLYMTTSIAAMPSNSFCTLYPNLGTPDEPIGLVYISGSYTTTIGSDSVRVYTLGAEPSTLSYYEGVEIGSIIRWSGKFETSMATGSLLSIDRWTIDQYDESNNMTLIFNSENTVESSIQTAFISSSIPYNQSADIHRYIPLFDSDITRPLLSTHRVGRWASTNRFDPGSGLYDPIVLGADVNTIPVMRILMYRSSYGKLVEMNDSSISDSINILRPSIRSYTIGSPTASIINPGIQTTDLNANDNPISTDGTIQYGSAPADICDIRYYKDTSGDINTDVLKSHTISPSIYSPFESGSTAYDTLLQRYTLLSNNVTTTSGYEYQVPFDTLISPDQPKRSDLDRNLVVLKYTPVTSSFSAFEEQWYYPVANIGGTTMTSDKIRVEENTLNPNEILNNDFSIQRSSFDKFSVDSNRVGIYFSPQDSINFDILNQYGDINLDQYIGDPGDLNKLEYSALQNFSREYWRKYQQPADFESYFRALSVYDFTIFTYIKRLLPARARAVTGLVIEPNILQRSKARLSRSTSVSNLMYTASIAPEVSELNSTISNITAVIDGTTPIYSIAQVAYQGLITDISDIDRLGTRWNQNRFIGKYKIVESGSYEPLQLFISGSRFNVQFSEIRYLYSTPESASLELPDSEYYVISQFSDDRSTGVLNSRYNGSKLSAAAINVPSVNTFDGGPVVSSVQVDPNQVTYNNGELIVG